MINYLKSAIDALYGKDDDFIILGLTGRTGSGCSTVAKILQAQKDEIRHSLYFGDNPETNEERKQKIIKNHFEKTWEPFNLIQVRSVLTLLLAKEGAEKTIKYIKHKKFTTDENILNNIKRILKEIIELHKLAKSKKSFKDFYTKELPYKSDEIKKILEESVFINIYQQIGKNIRSSGNPIVEKLYDNKFFTLADEINEIVKNIRKEIKEKTLIVIDAIRHPLEAIYFQERYAAFFLLAISCDDNERKIRLNNLKFSDDDIKKLDEAEYSSNKLENNDSFSVQDIQGCLQRADLYIHNPTESNSVSEFKTLANQVISFVSLMKHPGLVTPSAIERCMQIAYTAKLNSGCISRQVGAVVTDSNFAIKSVGWNDVPHGQVPCK